MDSLVFCTTPQEYIDMYKCGDSCMSMKASNTTDLGWELWTKRGLWSSMWYAYIPGLKGVLLDVDGEKLARGFVLRNMRIGPIYWDDSVSGGWKFTKRGAIPVNPIGIRECWHKYNDLMNEAGYKTKIECVVLNMEFEVPAVEWQGQCYCPLPHVDFIAKPFRVRFDKARKVFIFEPFKGGTGKIIVSTYDYSMWLNENLERAGKPIYNERAFNEFFRSYE